MQNNINLLIIKILKKLSLSNSDKFPISITNTAFEIVNYVPFNNSIISEYLNKDLLISFMQITDKFNNENKLIFKKNLTSKQSNFSSSFQNKNLIFDFKYVFTKAFGSNNLESELYNLKSNDNKTEIETKKISISYDNNVDFINFIYTKLGYSENTIFSELKSTDTFNYKYIYLFIEILKNYKKNPKENIFTDRFISIIDNLIQKFDSDNLSNNDIKLLTSDFKSDIFVINSGIAQIQQSEQKFSELRKNIENHKTDDFFILDIDITDSDTNNIISSNSFEFDDEKSCIIYSNLIYSIYTQFIKFIINDKWLNNQLSNSILSPIQRLEIVKIAIDDNLIISPIDNNIQVFQQWLSTNIFEYKFEPENAYKIFKYIFYKKINVNTEWIDKEMVKINFSPLQYFKIIKLCISNSMVSQKWLNKQILNSVFSTEQKSELFIHVLKQKINVNEEWITTQLITPKYNQKQQLTIFKNIMSNKTKVSKKWFSNIINNNKSNFNIEQQTELNNYANTLPLSV